MRKIIVLLTLLLSAMNVMAQAYEFEAKEETFDDGTRLVECYTKDIVKFSASSPDIRIEIWDGVEDGGSPLLFFTLSKYACGQYKKSFAVAKKIRGLALMLPKETNRKENITIRLHLSNGEILHGTNSGAMSLSTAQRNVQEMLDSVGNVDAFIHLSLFESSNTPIQVQTLENLQMICQQLRTYDIVKIEVGGEIFDVRGLRSAATFDAMFNSLAKKTGKGDCYKVSPSASSVDSKLSATCTLGFVTVFSSGTVAVRVDNLRIIGAKGKDVTLYAIFDNELDCVSYTYELTSIPYDDCTYDHIRIKGSVDLLKNSMQNKRGHYKVFIGVEIDDCYVCFSNEMYVTFYKDQEGDWNKAR